MPDSDTNPMLSSPFIPSANSVGQVMRKVMYALIPGIVIYVLMFGWGIIVNILLATISAIVFEFIMLILRQRPIRCYLFDGSAVVTAILLSLALPPMLPWWVPVTGSFFAIVAAKHLYGGLGYNAFNPAMAAYAVLLVSFPRELSLWSAPLELVAQPLGFIDSVTYSFFNALPGSMTFDAITMATPLDHLRTETGLGRTVDEIRRAPMFGLVAGLGTEWVNAGFLLGGLWLIYKKVITWHIPFAMLASIAVISSACFALDAESYASPALHLLGGASILGAFFIATDPVTASTTPLGRFIYGCGIGLLTFAIRAWGGYPDGVAFAVLLIGLTVPLLDHYTAPRVYGARARHGHP
jgi:electron transport complex protein RnfD